MTRRLARCLVAAALAWAALPGCSPQTALLAAAVPDGATAALLAHTQRVRDDNRRRIVALDAAGDWAGLAQFAQAQLQRDPNTPDWWLVAGYAYSRQGRHVEAAGQYAEAVRLEPDVTLAWTLLAEAYQAAGDTRRALATLDNALLARRDAPQLHWLQAELYAGLERWPEAIAAYRASLALDARHRAAWQGLERAYRASGRVDEAAAAARELAKLQATAR